MGHNQKTDNMEQHVVYEHNLKSHVALIADSRIDGGKINPKLLDSVKDKKQFKMYLAFESTKLNLILNMRELATKYPTKNSLEKAYVFAQEKHVIDLIEDDVDELPDFPAMMTPLFQEPQAVLASIIYPQENRQT
ncbi:hypothetical protein KEM48_010033 [Puccinia striiformis f. sp. tritici PST-130]|nr:hypothetical protein KEM48_010033 [Puccinia striiformis f. sp. tritici PST-130]